MKFKYLYLISIDKGKEMRHHRAIIRFVHISVYMIIPSQIITEAQTPY